MPYDVWVGCKQSTKKEAATSVEFTTLQTTSFLYIHN